MSRNLAWEMSIGGCGYPCPYCRRRKRGYCDCEEYSRFTGGLVRKQRTPARAAGVSSSTGTPDDG